MVLLQYLLLYSTRERILKKCPVYKRWFHESLNDFYTLSQIGSLTIRQGFRDQLRKQRRNERGQQFIDHPFHGEDPILEPYHEGLDILSEL